MFQMRTALCNAQQAGEEPRLPMQVVPGNTESLSFANHVRRFDPLNHRPSCRCRARPLHGAQPPFHVVVIRFDSVIARMIRISETVKNARYYGRSI